MNTSALLDVVHLRKEFPSGHTIVRAVDDVSFTTDRGQITLIMGPSGSGKTTLLTMIGTLLRPTSGQVFIDGCEITNLDRRALPEIRRRSIGFIFQTFNLIESLSAQENVELAMNVNGVSGVEAADRARALLTAGGLAKRMDARTRDLSGGEKQRVSIARALANHPPLLLADEPTANLDTQNGREVMELLADLARQHNTAVVAVSHDTRLASFADKVLWLEDGRFRNQPADVAVIDDAGCRRLG
jgi:putative ABC transport system ATP-binding protein